MRYYILILFLINNLFVWASESNRVIEITVIRMQDRSQARKDYVDEVVRMSGVSAENIILNESFFSFNVDFTHIKLEVAVQVNNSDKVCEILHSQPSWDKEMLVAAKKRLTEPYFSFLSQGQLDSIQEEKFKEDREKIKALLNGALSPHLKLWG